MCLGKRSTWCGSGLRGQLTALTSGLTLGLGLTLAATAQAATVGPARIVCNASFCEMGSGARPKERVRVIVSELPREEISRLRKCTGVAKPCIVIIDGIQQDSKRPASPRVLAQAIRWQD